MNLIYKQIININNVNLNAESRPLRYPGMPEGGG